MVHIIILEMVIDFTGNEKFSKTILITLGFSTPAPTLFINT